MPLRVGNDQLVALTFKLNAHVISRVVQKLNVQRLGGLLNDFIGPECGLLLVVKLSAHSSTGQFMNEVPKVVVAYAIHTCASEHAVCGDIR